MTDFPKVFNLFTHEEIDVLAQRLMEVIQSIKSDYFNTISMEQFYQEYIFHESVVMKCVAMRFATEELWNKLKHKIDQEGEGIDKSQPVYFHPIFYARFSSAEYKLESSVFLDSQPHYDRAFGLYAFSYWLALKQANKASGGLCFFSENHKVNDEFTVDWSQKNKYNYDLYVDSFSRLDPFIKESCIHPDLDAGQAYQFDSNILHAATKPISDDRLSFDFRFFQKCSLESLDDNVRRIIENFNKNINLSNALNLIVMGDIKGALRLAGDAKQYLDVVKPKYDINKSYQKFSWQDEYSWCKAPTKIKF